MNTAIRYRYRDGANYKYDAERIVVAGAVRYRDLYLFLDRDAADIPGFVPADVGLPHPGSGMASWPDPEIDHPWCELEADMFRQTEDPPTHGTASDLIERFRKASAAGWPGQNKPLSEM